MGRVNAPASARGQRPTKAPRNNEPASPAAVDELRAEFAERMAEINHNWDARDAGRRAERAKRWPVAPGTPAVAPEVLA